MKLKYLFLLFALVSVTVFSCSKDDDNSPNTSDNTKIVGTWDLDSVHIMYEENGETTEEESFGEDGIDYTEYEFKSDNSYVLHYKADDGSNAMLTGTYTLSNGKLSLKRNTENGTPPYFFSDRNEMLCSIDGQQMGWTWYANVSDVGNDTKLTLEMFFVKK